MLAAAFDRPEAIRRLETTDFDVVVVGGGITGVGCALDAAARGLRTALIERDDFASGTSSRSSKLVHGGLRYLQQGEVRLVYEALLERQRLLRNAPHLVKVLPFLIPMITGRDGVLNPKLARALGSAMWAYDLTGGVRIGKLHRRISVDEAVRQVPTLRADRLAPSYLYYDAQADDARLTLTVARTAALDHGAVVVNRASLASIERDAAGQVESVGVDLHAPGEQHRTIAVRTSSVVNATGVWADDVTAIAEGSHPHSIRPAKGIHITVPWSKLRNDIAVVVPVRQDKRSIFVVRWGDLAYAGTTDTDFDGDPDDPQCTPDDVAYVLDALNAAFTTDLTPDDVTGTWAGLRPLVNTTGSGRTADLSRRHRVGVGEGGLVTVTGGKLTTYRKMAADTIDALLDGVLPDEAIARAARRSTTKRLRLRGADGYDELVAAAPALSRHLPAVAVDHLAHRYGGEAHALIAMVERDPSLGASLVPGLPYLRAEALYAVRYEMALSIDDVLSRRTRARLLRRDDSAEVAEAVAELIGPELSWDEAESARQVAEYRASIEHERAVPELPETALSHLAPHDTTGA
jgi:glycerol-3-phosphate dehydrogenase